MKGQGLVEYAAVLLITALVILTILTSFGSQIGDVFSKIGVM